MASTNGVLSPPSHPESENHSLSLSAKRKREDSVEGPNQHQINGSASPDNEAAIEHNKTLIKDLLDVLKIHDPSPSILTRPLLERPEPTEPQPKRQKADASADASTILARTTSNTYTTLDEVLRDVDSVVADITEKLELPNSAARNQYRPISEEQMDTSLKVSAFKKRAHDLVRKEKSKTKPASLNGTSETSGTSTHVQINTTSGDNKMVLTLYGNAPQPKQLFSSLQESRKVPGEAQSVIPALREAGLPPGITTTRIVPVTSAGLVAEKKQRAQTLGELFATPANVPALQPPKPSKIGTTRSSNVGWYQPSLADTPPKTSSYFRQNISTGHWVDYSNAGPTPVSKRKQRDRAMSLGGSKAPPQDAEPAESEAAKLDALFRSAYSSFAPTKDNSAALVPDSMLDRLWWQQIGEKSFERFVDNANKLEDVLEILPAEKDAADGTNVDDDENLRDAVEWYENNSVDPNLETAEKSAEEKDVEEILDGISELLETLNSYQRIRNVSLKPTGSQVGILSAPDPVSSGTPSKPSDQEMATYEILKSQLTLMIATLPPFAVAKLKPDQLADLGISTRIPVEMENYNGVMEEDEAGTRAKALMSAATATSRLSQVASLQRNNSTPSYGNQYPARPQAPAAQQYYSQSPIRPPQRPTNAPVQYPNQGRPPVSNGAYRPNTYGTGSYGSGTPTYPHQNPRPIQQQQQYPNTTPYPTQGYARPVSQPYQNLQQPVQPTPLSARYSSQPGFPQQTQAPNYQYTSTPVGYNNPSNTGRQPSPQKIAAYSPQPMSARPSYPASTPTPPIQDRKQFLQNPMALTQSPMINGGSSQSPQLPPALPPAIPQQQSTGYSTFMTTEEQSSMMERQRAQLAQQQGTQQQARQMAQAALQSPSKTQVAAGS